jgi:L-ascorbate metabolism protein UlaG (beta-lactamase superfamily)
MKNQTQIYKFEHSAIIIQHDGARLAVDPGSLTSEESRAKLRGLDAVLITHVHGDHFDSTVLRGLRAPVYGPPDVAALAKKAGLEAKALNIGMPVNVAGAEIMPVGANHGPAVTKPIANYGYVVKVNGKRIYVTGDVAGQQSDVPRGPFDVVTVPIEGGGFVFEPVEAAQFLNAMGHEGFAIALHADDAVAAQNAFVEAAAKFCKPVVIGVGEELIV